MGTAQSQQARGLHSHSRHGLRCQRPSTPTRRPLYSTPLGTLTTRPSCGTSQSTATLRSPCGAPILQPA
eukprot:234349-Pelagomonas_calceolata.AAC.1